MKTVYNLHDAESEEILGAVGILSKNTNAEDELRESWEEFNKLEEHELDSQNVDVFIQWNNENRITQIERVYIEFIQF